MNTAYQIVVCAGIVPDPLQTLEPVNFRLPIGGALNCLSGLRGSRALEILRLLEKTDAP